MPTRNVNLTDDLDRFVERMIATGAYADFDDMVERALLLLEQQQLSPEERIERLRAAIRLGDEALANGDYVDVSVDDLGEFLAGLDETSRRRRE